LRASCELRRKQVRRFGHLVIFEVTDDAVRVFAVWHPSRDLTQLEHRIDGPD
jgi:hypothetical protein